MKLLSLRLSVVISTFFFLSLEWLSKTQQSSMQMKHFPLISVSCELHPKFPGLFHRITECQAGRHLKDHLVQSRRPCMFLFYSIRFLLATLAAYLGHSAGWLFLLKGLLLHLAWYHWQTLSGTFNSVFQTTYEHIKQQWAQCWGSILVSLSPWWIHAGFSQSLALSDLW